MRVRSATLHHLRIPFKTPFIHALSSRTHSETLIVTALSDDGVVGVGEILPRPYLTGEDFRSAKNSVAAVAQLWAGQTFETYEDVVTALRRELESAGRNLAALAGWELAVLDLAGKTFSVGAGDLLGPVRKSYLEPAAIIDFSIPTASLQRHCTLLRLRGQRYLKVKVGQNLEVDIRRLEIVSEVMGAKLPLRIDANGIWAADEAIAAIRRMSRINIASVEQPVPAPDLRGLAKVRAQTGVPVVADESLCTLEDARALIAAKAADIFNIRIAKCGGLIGSARLVRVAEEAGLTCQLGTLVGETGILSCAGEIFGQRVGDFEFLEGKQQNRHLLLQDIVTGNADSTHATGLGVEISFDVLSKCSAFPPTILSAEGATA